MSRETKGQHVSFRYLQRISIVATIVFLLGAVFIWKNRTSVSSGPKIKHPRASSISRGTLGLKEESGIPVTSGNRHSAKVESLGSRSFHQDSSEWFNSVKGELYDQFGGVVKEQGLRAAYRYLLEILLEAPQDLHGRVRRAYAFRFLPFIASQDPALRSEVLSLMEHQAAGDRDPYARCVALSAILDYPVVFRRYSEEEGSWFVNTTVRFFSGSARYDFVCMQGTLKADDRLRAIVRERLQHEESWENRAFLIQALAAEPDQREIDLFTKAALSDQHESVRNCALTALAKFAPTAVATDVLSPALLADTAASNRKTALFNLIELGVADEVSVSRLLEIQSKDLATYRTIGRAYTITKSPNIRVFLQSQLKSNDPETRAQTIKGIRSSRDREFLADLQFALEKEADPSIRKEVVDAIADLQNTP